MSTKFLSPGWRMPRNANQSKFSNYSMDFDGSQHIDIGSDISVSGNCTVSFWFKSPAIPDTSSQAIFARFTGLSDTDFLIIGLYLQGVLASNDSNLASSKTTKANITLVTDTWYHCVVTKVSGVVNKIYIDGTDRTGPATNPGESWSSQASNSGFIGQRGYGGKFIGQIDALAIFDYALSSSQVTTLWGGGTSVSNPMALPSPPIAYYPLGGSAAAFRTPVNTGDQWLIENNAIGDYVFDFDGSNDITVSHNSYFDQSVYSFSFWINNNLNSGVSNDGIITADSSTRGWSILQDNQTFKFNPNISGGSGQTDVTNFFNTTSTWIHCAITFDGTNLIIYKNGTSVGSSSSGTRNLNSNNNPLTIGNNTFASGRFFNGKLSNVQIFNSALSEPEVQTLYNYGSPIRTLANIPQSSNLKAWYKLDASEVYNSTTTEWSIDNNQNPSAYASSLDFDAASSDAITLGNTIGNGFTQITCSAWVNLSTTELANNSIYRNFLVKFNGTALGPFELRGNYARGDSGNNKLFFRVATDTGSYGFTDTGFAFTEANRWYHIVGTYDGSNVKTFVDGVEKSSISANGTLVSNSDNATIGFDTSTGSFDGKISNPSIWNAALTPTQVTELYNNGTPSNLSSHSATSNLVSWWKLNNTTTGIEDAKGSNNGTNNGATEYTGFVNKLVGDSSGMSQANLVQSDLQTVAPYSKYAMDFDASSGDYIDASTLSVIGDWSVSLWVKTNSTSYQTAIQLSNSTTTGNNDSTIFLYWYPGGALAKWGFYSGQGSSSLFGTTALNTNQWYHLVVTKSGATYTLFLNASQENQATLNNINIEDFLIGGRSYNNFYMDGSISNASIWNTALTSSQVTEIYNEGLPSNLNSHSAYSNLVSWWQLGENSSFDGNDWIVADEKGTNNGTSVSMPVGALTNGVGTTANGVSNGMSEGNLVGDAPYSTANALSTNMIVTSRVSGVSDATITTGGTGYVTGTNIATTGGSGTNCTINITTVSGGVITAITINNGGSNYVIGDVLTISGGNGNATITVSGLNTP